ncbi:DUF5808 domain-containing protein [Mucilaginibacter segetis]|uniref:DUF5808 domain-containing protein n=1 Tax=Mucilaginibacter segetis TaxID=2793071 RepID=A0A934PTI8_9SPHI|nr:DUF5808 domain-containing protein [Mucilaginibacter segetis]MBK0380554.1 hypothetical protein [Mucilaginibacter segetis]
MEPTDRSDPRYWKLGFIYYNPDDPAFLVGKRFGLGYTFNFAHKAVWLFFVAILIIPWVVRVIYKK